MADPMSISASIASLVSITDTVFTKIFNYVKSVKGTPQEVRDLSTSIGALSGILHNLLLVARQLEGESFDTTIQITHISSCRLVLNYVKTMLDKFGASPHGTQMEKMKRFKWPFSASEAKSLIGDLERHKTALSLALDVDGLSSLLRALSAHKDLQASIDNLGTELKQKREAEVRLRLSGERRDILDWISPHDPHQHHYMSLNLRHPETVLWLIASDEVRTFVCFAYR